MTDQFKQVEASYKAEKYEAAVNLLEEILNEDEAYRDSFFLNGETLSEQSLSALFLKGQIYYECGESDTAEECLSEIPETNSNYHNVCLMRGRMYHKEFGDYDEAIELYGKIPESSELFADARHEIALVYCAQGDYQTALDMLNQLLADNDMYGNILHSIAHVYSGMGDKAKQMEFYNKVPFTDPSYGKVQISKAVQLEKDGHIEEALASLASIPSNDEYYYQGLLNSAHILVENKRMQEAINSWAVVPPASPYYNKALYQRATIYAESGDLQAALDEADRIPALSDEYLDVLELKRNTYRELKDKKMAERYGNWYTMLEMRWCFDGLIGNCMMGEFTPEQELEFWNSIPESSPEYYYAVVQKAAIYKKIKDFDTAGKLLDSIPQEQRRYIAEKYHYNFEKLALLDEEEK